MKQSALSGCLSCRGQPITFIARRLEGKQELKNERVQAKIKIKVPEVGPTNCCGRRKRREALGSAGDLSPLPGT